MTRRAMTPRRRTRAPARKPLHRTGAGVALAGLAHDIRTPLTGMLALSDLLLASNLPERERGWAAAIKDAAGHLARLTTLVVDAAKAGTGKLILQPEPFALRDFIDAAAQSLKARADAKSIGVEISIDDALTVRVSADAVRLRSALENLIDNAVKFTERGQVSLAVVMEPSARRRLKLTFTVVDTGIGIVAADLKRLFRPFSQANESVAQRFGGSGLGLSFARRIAAAMGGSLTVKSRPGQGSTFRLVVLVDPAPPEKKAANASADALTGLRVLCVEDNPYGRVVLNTVLSELGHQVSFAESGESALTAVARGGYDAVLMDVALPGIDGFETTRRIRVLPGPCSAIPIIGVSGRTGEEDEAAAYDAGMSSYLRKPASPATLNAALAAVAVLKRRR
ncbi:MAG: ATP-binding protein [Xanthobacteraceae bacterium]